MAMKKSTDPRRIYTRNGVTHVLVSGSTFAAPADTKIDNTMTATVEIAEDEKTAKVTVKAKGKKPIVETWKTKKGGVPHEARA